MKLYPVMLDLRERFVVIVGGGTVALRKARGLVEVGTRLRLVAPRMHADLIALACAHPEHVELVQRTYQEGDLDGAVLVFAATPDRQVNQTVCEHAGSRGLFVNTADDVQLCSFFVPSTGRRGSITLALSSCGKSPALAARLRREIERSLPDDIEQVLNALEKARALLKNDPAFAQLEAGGRGNILRTIVDDDRLLTRLNAHSRHEQDLRNFLLGLVC